MYGLRKGCSGGDDRQGVGRQCRIVWEDRKVVSSVLYNVGYNRRSLHFRPGKEMLGRERGMTMFYLWLNSVCWVTGLNQETKILWSYGCNLTSFQNNISYF